MLFVKIVLLAIAGMFCATMGITMGAPNLSMKKTLALAAFIVFIAPILLIMFTAMLGINQ